MSAPAPFDSPVYQELATALRERLAVIADRAAYARDPQAHLAQLQTVSTRIVALGSELPPPVDRQLAHYLQRCSYDKALAFLTDAGPGGEAHRP